MILNAWVFSDRGVLRFMLNAFRRLGGRNAFFTGASETRLRALLEASR